MADASQLLGITQVAMTVSDVPRAVNVFRDAVGLPQLPIPAPPTMAFLIMGDVRLMITQPEPGLTPGSGTVIYLGADERSQYMTTSYHIDTVS